MARVAKKKVETKKDERQTAAVTAFDEFFNINYGAPTAPEKAALKIVLSEIISKWEVFKTYHVPEITTAGNALIRYVGLTPKYEWTGDAAKRYNRKHAFSSCWYIEFHADRKVYLVDYDGVTKKPHSEAEHVFRTYFKDGKFDGQLLDNNGWCMELTAEQVKP